MAEFVFCVECGNKNKISAKFCSNCGSSLILLQSEKLRCNKCGYENDNHINYCASCGSKLKQKRVTHSEKKIEHSQSKKQEIPQNKSWYLNPLVIIGLLVIAMFVSYLIIDGKTQKQSPSVNQSQVTFEKVTDNAELEKNIMEVASKFVCACESCNELPLESCSCEVAQKERQFIRTALQGGEGVEQVIFAVNDQFGWIRPEYKSKFGEGKLVLNKTPTAGHTILFPEANTDESLNIRLASLTDRMEIISHFVCTCGECEYDKLEDCDCDHPGGAREIKQFIDNAIEKNKHTPDEIIQLVDATYGNKIK